MSENISALQAAQLEAAQQSLLAYGQSAPEVVQHLQRELEDFEAHLHQRQADWLQVQAGREWSPAQEAEHVLLVNESVMKVILLLLSDEPLPERPKRLGELVGGKRQAPSYTLPSAQGLSWDDLSGRWVQHTERLTELAEAVRPTPERQMWHPFLGDLDALNWLRMLVYHTQSHRLQLEKSAPDADNP